MRRKLILATTLLLVIPLFQLLFLESVKAAFSYSAGAPETVYTHQQRLDKGLNLWPDGTMGFLNNGDGTYDVYGHDSPSSAKTTGPLNDIAETVHYGSAGGGILNLKDTYDYAGGGPVYKDPNTGTIIKFYHGERNVTGGFYSIIGIAVSKDNGQTFTDAGEIVTPNMALENFDLDENAEVFAGPFLVIDGYFYLYFKDYHEDDTIVNLAVARAPVDDVLSAADNFEVTNWQKYHNGSFSEDGIGGLSSPLEDGNPIVYNLDVIYSQKEEKYLAVLMSTNNYWYIVQSDDGVNWSERIQLTNVGFPDEERFYTSIVSDNTGDPKVAVDDFYLYYLLGTRFADVDLMRIKVNINTVELGQITVNSTADDDTAGDGECTLREAINNVNDNNDSTLGDCVAGADTGSSISFDIPGSGVQTITPESPLPTITETVVIDGTTQPGASCQPRNLLIEIDGTNAGDTDAHGVWLGPGSDGSTVNGLTVNNFADDGIYVESDDNTITCNHSGTDPTATTGEGNLGSGIDIFGDNNTIGGTSSTQRNIFSDNAISGVAINSDDNDIIGNYIGLNGSGDSMLSNCQTSNTGNLVIQGNNNQVGGSETGSRNIIAPCAMNTQFAVMILGSFAGTNTSGNRVQGNYIGTDKNGNPLSDSAEGSAITMLADTINNLIGGANPGEGNLIRGNGAGVFAVSMTPLQSVNNSIVGNSIYQNSGNTLVSSLGIDLLESSDFGSTFINNGVTANDLGDPDESTNHYMNFPVLNQATSSDGKVNITYSLDINDAESGATGYRVEFFANDQDEGHGQGQILLGADIVDGDVTERTVTLDVPKGVNGTKFLTATTTMTDDSDDGFGHTSEFSATLEAILEGPDSGSVIDNLADTGRSPAVVALIAVGLIVSGLILLRKNRSTSGLH